MEARRRRSGRYHLVADDVAPRRNDGTYVKSILRETATKGSRGKVRSRKMIGSRKRQNMKKRRVRWKRTVELNKGKNRVRVRTRYGRVVQRPYRYRSHTPAFKSVELLKEQETDKKGCFEPPAAWPSRTRAGRRKTSTVECFSRYGRVSRPPVRLMQPCPSPPKLMRLSLPDQYIAPRRRKAGKKCSRDMVVATTVQNVSITKEDEEESKEEQEKEGSKEKEVVVPMNTEPVPEAVSAEVQDTSHTTSDSLAVVVKLTEDCETDSGGEFNTSVSPSPCGSGYSVVGCEATANIGTNGEELDDPSKTPFSWDGSTSSGLSLRVSTEEERPKMGEDEFLAVSPQTATISMATKEEMIRECAKALEGYSDEEEAQVGCLIATDPVDTLQCSGGEVEQPELYMNSVVEDKLPIAVQFSRLCEEYAQTEEQPAVDLEFERIGCDSLVVMDTDLSTTEQPSTIQEGVLDLNADSDKDFRSVSPCTSYLSSEEDIGDSALSEDDLEGGGGSSSEEDQEETACERDSVSSEIDFDEEDDEVPAIPPEDLSKDKISYRSGEDSDREEDRALSQESDRDTSDTDSYRESEEDRSSCSSFAQQIDEDSCAVENVLDSENPVAPPEDHETEDNGLDFDALRTLLLEQVKKLCDKCVYCNHAKRIAVNGQQLLSHLQEEHSVDLQTTISEEMKATLSEKHINSTDGDRQYECFRCIKSFCLHTELCVHNRKCHQNSILCIMCKRTFRSYSELVCHLCSGSYLPEDTSATTYRCCLCGPTAPGCGLSAFRLMVHLRRRHVTCDVCLQEAEDQQDLANHIRIHKLPHLCHHCGIAYRNKHDMKKHMFWKHGTESVLCKKCLQRKWPHQYHFCVPPDVFHCDKCDASFAKAVALRVHTRIHDLIYPHSCKECREQFISKKLLNKHQKVHKQNVEDEMQAQCLEELKECDNLPTSIPVHTENVGEDIGPNMQSDEVGSLTTTSSCCRFEISSIPALNLSSDGEDSDAEDSADEDTRSMKPSHLDENSKTTCIDGENILKQGVSISGRFSEILAAVSTLESSIMKEHDYCVIATQVHDDVPGPDGDRNLFPTAPVAKMNKPRRRRKLGLEIVERLTSSSSDSSSDSSSSCCSCSSCCDSSDTESSSESSCASPTRLKDSPCVEPQTADGEEDAMALDCGNIAEKYSINESDLETDESESDSEDFYEEFPEQKGSKLVADNHQDTVTSHGEGKDQNAGDVIVVARKRAATSLMDVDTEDSNRTPQKMVVESDASVHRRYSKRSRVCKKFSDEWCGGEDLEQGAGHKLVMKRKTRAGESCPLDTDTGKAQSDMTVGRKRLNSKLLGGTVRKKARTEPQTDNNQRLYCYCRKPHDPESRMIGCDGKNCKMEWFHFDCVNIFIAPKGKWYCPDCSSGCKPRYKRAECDRKMGV